MCADLSSDGGGAGAGGVDGDDRETMEANKVAPPPRLTVAALTACAR